MTITINGEEIKLNPEEVKSARRIVSKFFHKIDQISSEKGQPTYYFTLLIIAHVISGEALDHIQPERLAMFMNEINNKR